jgi:hypothetical protein
MSTLIGLAQRISVPRFSLPAHCSEDGSRQKGIGLFEKKRQSGKCTSYKARLLQNVRPRKKSCGPLKSSVIGVLGIDMAGASWSRPALLTERGCDCAIHPPFLSLSGYSKLY